jgi:peroxiredoxin
MAQFEPHKDEIVQLNGILVYIAAEKRDGFFKPAKFLQGHPASFAFLLDEDRSVTKAYGLYQSFGHDGIRIAHPATLIAGRDGKLSYIYRGKSQMDRAPLEEVMAALREAAR